MIPDIVVYEKHPPEICRKGGCGDCDPSIPYPLDD